MHDACRKPESAFSLLASGFTSIIFHKTLVYKLLDVSQHLTNYMALHFHNGQLSIFSLRTRRRRPSPVPSFHPLALPVGKTPVGLIC